MDRTERASRRVGKGRRGPTATTEGSQEMPLGLEPAPVWVEDLLGHMLDGFALHELVYDETGRAVDYRFLRVNEAAARSPCQASPATLLLRPTTRTPAGKS